MRVIDLTQKIFSEMKVYPGDPRVEIEKIHEIKKKGWELRLLKLGSHTGTHVDAFSHMDKEGRSLSEIPIERFIGKAQVVNINSKFPKDTGLAFVNDKLDIGIYKKIESAKARFVLIGKDCDFPIKLEKRLLENKILTFTGLINLERLPVDKPFMFYGVPLNIKDGDGSPIRALAVLD